jgi:energy-coupling factor transporter ATP-binding protein EcfA2
MSDNSIATSSSSAAPSGLPSTGLVSIAPLPTNRALIVGQTGSGKTTLARQFVGDALTRRGRFVVLIDMKGTLTWSFPGIESEQAGALEQAVRSNAQLICYRPTYAESQSEVTQGALWEWLYRRMHTTIYVDETAAVTQGDVYPFYYGAVLMRGRELGLELWSATQRPLRIPQVVLSESEDVYAFRLRLPQDRARVESLTAIPAPTIAGLRKREFVYAPQDGDVSGRMTLNLTR